MKNNIKFLRRSAEYDITQEQLAKAIQVSRLTITAIENGRKTSDENVMKLAHFFNKDPREIFFLDCVVCSLHQEEAIHT